MEYLKVWECLAKVNIPINKKRKIRPKIIDCVFVEYSLHSTTYRLLVVNLEVFKISNDTISLLWNLEISFSLKMFFL